MILKRSWISSDFNSSVVDLATKQHKAKKHILFTFTQKNFETTSVVSSKSYSSFNTISWTKDSSTCRFLNPENDYLNTNKHYSISQKLRDFYSDKSNYKYSSFCKEFIDFVKTKNWSWESSYKDDIICNTNPAEVIISNFISYIASHEDIYIAYDLSEFTSYAAPNENKIDYSFDIVFVPVYNTSQVASLFEKYVNEFDLKNILLKFNNINFTYTIKTSNIRKVVPPEEKYEQNILTDANDILIENGDIVIFNRYGLLFYDTVDHNTKKCIFLKKTNTSVTAKEVMVVRSGNLEKMKNIPWNKGPCEIKISNNSYWE